jgi:hypothetical protein
MVNAEKHFWSGLHRSMKEALRQLKELQAERRERRQAEMDDAIRLGKSQQMKGLPFDPHENGFVYAGAEIALESARRDRFEIAKRADNAGFNLAEYPQMTQVAPCSADDRVVGDLQTPGFPLS